VDGTKIAKDATIVGGESSDGGLYFGAGKTFEAGSFFSGLKARGSDLDDGIITLCKDAYR